MSNLITLSSLNFNNHISFSQEVLEDGYVFSSLQLGKRISIESEDDIPLFFSSLIVFIEDEVIVGPLEILDEEEIDEEEIEDMYWLIKDSFEKGFLSLDSLISL
jgi:hypothetical protein